MTPAFASSQFALALAMGACAAIGLLHLLLWQRARGAYSHVWVAAFCASGLLLQAGRYLEVHSAEVASTLLGGRLQVVSAPLLILSLLAFARSVCGRRWRPAVLTLHLLVALAIAGVALFTEIMINDQPLADTDWFGDRHLSSQPGPGLALLSVYFAVAYADLVWEIRRSPRISPLERHVVIGSVAAFTALGLLTLASAFELTDLPSTSHYGPVLIAAGLTFLLAQQHRRMNDDLERMADERARRLQETDARYRQLVDSAPLGIMALDRSGGLIALNPCLCDMMKLPRDVMQNPGMQGLRVLEIPRVVERGLAKRLRGCLETGRPFVDQVEIETERSGAMTMRLEAAAICDSGGAIVGVQVIVEDEGERQRLEKQVRQSKKMEAVGGLAAGIAHEINNPMSYVRANLKMLQAEWRELVDPDRPDRAGREDRLKACEELIADSLEGVERTVTIVREVNDFSHGNADYKTEADLNALMDDSLRIASLQIGGGIEVVRAYAEIPCVVCSPSQLQQVFLNLLVNAVQAVEGTGRIRVESEHLAAQSEVAIRVIDDGGGIPPDHLTRVFEPFFTTKAAGQGTGLGLYICYEVVRMHDGTLNVESEPGAGTTFEVRLPER